MAQTLLSIGGSGFVSGTLARRAVGAGWDVTVVSRGQRPLPEGVRGITADRKDQTQFAEALSTCGSFDLVVDCIGYDPEDAVQDVEQFRNRTKRFVFVSTDFVFDPAHRQFPQAEESQHYLTQAYGGKKRQCEQVLLDSDCGQMEWTVVRPCHIYGPGSLLGCLPAHGRDKDLIERIRRGDALQLVGGGHFLQQPILAADLADLMLSLVDCPRAEGQIFQAAGPDLVESRTFYAIIADLLGVELQIEELSVDAYLQDNPASAPFLCHRIYDLSRLRSVGAAVPSTPLVEGLRSHVEAVLANRN
ncbi:MAG TPA: NAD-dependent epimerase/dehydratase family protein [Candidatus Latescibacteria bacterium]|jgi:nucleoside-diphosphate-sugar epimerase|nr:NAD-dependent dehydratase [Gemmatimonadota bacterium]MDP7361478.1 NAD-dependent epimerase/dehydratase family protein [Candidatus Latescibacterota bacterium]MDP7631694.1 NAD-dependent epimerase/dehydratase family protein [Candidatus Latescibacterota bacterium]HCV24020.1 NAD-dependent dehydratase [Candidatus Latescibacterota bacterium]HJN27094.1 NAD-dependent epimerase/dehydratase family protein [Candidatus Latescibacterota bacterium]